MSTRSLIKRHEIIDSGPVLLSAKVTRADYVVLFAGLEDSFLCKIHILFDLRWGCVLLALSS